MIYNDIEKQRLKKGENRTILSVIMNEITIDGKPMDDKNAIKKLQQIKKTIMSLGIKKEIKSMGMLMEELKKSFDVIDGSLVKNILLN